MVKQMDTDYKPYSTTNLPTKWGEFKTTAYRNNRGEEHLAISFGLDKVSNSEVIPLVRIHSACFTSEVLGSMKCDCREQLEYALEKIQKEGCGVVVYLFQEGRGIGLGAKIHAYSLQEKGKDTVDANTELGYAEDARTYECAVDILKDLGITKLKLLTNNPEKISAIDQAGFEWQREEIEVGLNEVNHGYLVVKKQRMGHLFSDKIN